MPDPQSPPADVAQASITSGVAVPYIVRVETGTINRGIYQIAMLYNPARDAAPDFMTKPAGWNGRLIYTFGGGCMTGWFEVPRPAVWRKKMMSCFGKAMPSRLQH